MWSRAFIVLCLVARFVVPQPQSTTPIQDFGYGQQYGQGPNQNVGGQGQGQGQFQGQDQGQYPPGQGPNQGQYPSGQDQFGQGPNQGQYPQGQDQGQFGQGGPQGQYPQDQYGQGPNQGQYPQGQDQFGQGSTPGPYVGQNQQGQYGQGQDQYTDVAQMGLQNLVQTAPFYNQLTPQSQQQFSQIFSNPSQTKRQLYDALAQFCRTQPYYIQSQLYTWSCQMLQIDSEIVRQMQQVQLSPQAYPFWQQIMRISWFNNLDVSLNSQTSQIANIIQNAPPQVQNELADAAERIQQTYDQRMTQLAQAAGAQYSPQGQYGQNQGYGNQYGGQNQYDQGQFNQGQGQYNPNQQSYGQQQPQYDQYEQPIQQQPYGQGGPGQQPQYDQYGQPMQGQQQGGSNQGQQGGFNQGQQGGFNQGQQGGFSQQPGGFNDQNQYGSNQQYGSSPYPMTSTTPASGGFGSG